MKSILLASVSVLGLAGAAAAEVTFSGSATLGYNDTDNPADDFHADGFFVGDPGDENIGFYSELNLDVAFSMELDYGVTVSAGADVDEVDAGDADFGGVWLKIATETASLTYGDTSFAAEDYWVSAGDMEADSFSAQDGETVLKGDFTFGAFSAGVSFAITDGDGDFAEDTTNVGGSNPGDLSALDQLSLGISGTFGNFTVALAYQEESQVHGYAPGGACAEDAWGNSIGTADIYDPACGSGDFNTEQVWGVSVGTTFGAADITVAYADEDNGAETSAGIKVSYPLGPVNLTAYYVMEGNDLDDDPLTDVDESDPDDNYGINVAYENGPIAVALDYQDDQGTQKVAIDGSYALDNGITVYAGAYQEEDQVDSDGDDVTQYYVAAEMDLGGGASLLFSYADAAGVNGDDEIGANDYQEGMTVEASFSF